MGFLKKLLKKRKLLLIIGLVLVVAVAGFIIFKGKAVKVSGTVDQQRTSTATKGQLSVTLSGSGSVSPVNRKEMIVAIDGVVSENYLEEGKSFKEGDVLAKFNDSDVQLSVKKLENELNQKNLSVISSNINNGALNVTAPFTGRITDLKVKNGDEVDEDSVLMTIVDESVLQTTVIFENASTSEFKGIYTIQIHIPEFMSTLTGRIQSLSQDGDNVGAIIAIDNPGALVSGLSVWAEAKISSGTLISTEGSLEYIIQEEIKAEVAGTISNLSALNDIKVSTGKTLLSIAGDALPYTIESKQLELEQAQVQLKLAREKLDFYTIKAPFDGVAVSVANLDPGDSIESATSIAILMDTSEMTFDVSIDELDISTVKIDQTVNVTVDALEDEEIEGTVTAIAPEGTTSNGVTSYAVTVTIPGIDDLKSGMNVDAVIQIFNKQDALLVPVEAIQKQGDGYMVWVKVGSQQAPQESERTSGVINGDEKGTRSLQQNKAKNTVANSYYSGAVPVQVTVGMHNETYMEITEGLSEGDVVILPKLVSSSDSDKTPNEEQGGAGMMMPGMGGGMPAGGGRDN